MINLKEKYETYFLINDLIVLSILFALGLYILYLLKINLYVLIPNKDNFYSAILTISSGLFVFLITSVTILISFLDNDKLSILKDTNHPRNMLKTFFSGIRIAGIETILLVFTHINIQHSKILFHVIIFVFSLMIIRVIRIIWILYNLSYILILSNK